MRVAFTWYPKGGEKTVWTTMPQCPVVGDTVHISFTEDPDDSRAWEVTHVSWASDGPVGTPIRDITGLVVAEVPGTGLEWHAELSVR